MLKRLALATWLLLACPPAWAAEWKPVAVVSFSGWAELISDIDFLGELVQNPALAATLGKALTQRSGVQSIEGLDPRRPWGVLVETDGLRVHPIAFVPVIDTRQLLQSLTPLVGEPQLESPGVWKIGQRTLTGYVREKDDWAFLAQSADLLERLPDPVAVLGDLPSKHDLAVSFFPAHLPEALRTLAIDEVRSQRRSRLAGPMGEHDDTPRLPLPLADLLSDSAEEFFTDIQRVTLGWTIDRKQKTASLEASFLPIKDSNAARRWSARQSAASVLQATRDEHVSADLSLTALPSVRYSELSTQYANGLLADAEAPAAQRRLALQLVSAIGAILDDAQHAGSKFAAIRVYGRSPPYTIVAALRLRDASLVEQQIQQLTAVAQDEDSFLRVKQDAARLGSLRVHSFEIVGEKEREPFDKLLGKDPTLYIATHGPHMLLACGHRALAAMEQSLPSETPLGTVAVEMSMRLGAALTALSRTTSNQSIVPLITLAALSLQAGDDRLSFTANANGEGLQARLECREALLRAAALGLNLVATQSSEKVTRPGRSP